MFDSMDLKSTGVITFDEWFKFSMEHILAKTATLDPHPILDHGNLEQFNDKDGIVTMSDFPAMLDRMLETPKKLAMVHPEERLMTPRGKITTRPCSRPSTPRVTTGCALMSGLSWLWKVFTRRWSIE